SQRPCTGVSALEALVRPSSGHGWAAEDGGVACARAYRRIFRHLTCCCLNGSEIAGVTALFRAICRPACIMKTFDESPSHNWTSGVPSCRHLDPRGAATAELHPRDLSDHHRTARSVWQRYSSSALVRVRVKRRAADARSPAESVRRFVGCRPFANLVLKCSFVRNLSHESQFIFCRQRPHSL